MFLATEATASSSRYLRDRLLVSCCKSSSLLFLWVFSAGKSYGVGLVVETKRYRFESYF